MKAHLAVIMLLLLSLARSANAQCYANGGGGAGSQWATTNVKVYIHRTAQSGYLGGMRYALAHAMSEAQIEYSVVKTLNIINEEVGGRIKLQYAGTTASATDIDDAIVLRSAATDCGPGEAGSSTVAVGSVRKRGRIEFWMKKGSGCPFISWGTVEGGGTDLVTTLIHELGHGFFDVGHPDEAGDPDNCDWPGLLADGTVAPAYASSTIMSNGGLTIDRSRVIKDWDREKFQVRHSSRAPYSQLQRSYRTGSSAWQVPFAVNYGSVFQYRPGSMSQGVQSRNFGYLYGSSTVQLTGGGTVSKGRYESLLTATAGSSSSLMRPVAVASKPGTNEVLLAYVERANGAYQKDADLGYICYRRSLDNGATYGSLSCQTSWVVHRNGLTATYNARNDAFLVAYAGKGLSGSSGDLFVGTIPANGSATPYQSFQITSGGNQPKSWHGPAIACRSDVNDSFSCRLVYEGVDTYGCATTLPIGFSLILFPSVYWVLNVSPAGPDSSPCFPVFDTPALAYKASTNSFEMLTTWFHDTIYAYSQAASTTDWSNDGTVYAASNSFVLTPVLSHRSYTDRFQAWFVKYN